MRGERRSFRYCGIHIFGGAGNVGTKQSVRYCGIHIFDGGGVGSRNEVFVIVVLISLRGGGGGGVRG